MVIGLILFSGGLSLAQQKVSLALEPEPQSTLITIGVLDNSSAKEAETTWRPLSQYLNRKFKGNEGYHFKIKSYSPQTISKALSSKQVDFILLDPGAFQPLQKQHDLTGVATLEKPSLSKNLSTPSAPPVSSLASVIFIHGGWNEIDLLTSLKGESVIAESSDNFELMISWETFKSQGVNPYKDLGQLRFIGKNPYKVADAVKKGESFAGILSTDSYYQLMKEGRFKKADFRVLNLQKAHPSLPKAYSTNVYPQGSFSGANHLSKAFLKEVSLALMTMPEESAEARALGIAGWGPHQDYTSAGQLVDRFNDAQNWSFQKALIKDGLQNYQVVWGFSAGLLGLMLYFINDGFRAKQALQNIQLDQTSLGKKLEFQAFNDPLTGLPNRRLMQDRLLQTIKHSSRDKKSFCVIMADLDHFKEVNDTLGHDAGDQLIKTVAMRLQETLRESDTICRIGGDEFAFICHDLAGDFALPLIANRLIGVLEEPVVVSGTACTVGVSLGIALYPNHGQDPEILMRKADIAMYKAKEKRNCFALYDQATDTRSRELFVLQNDIRTAILKDQFVVYFQPIINVADKTIIGVETLVRWIHPRKGMIMPDDFIPLARKTGQIKALTQLVLKKAIATGGKWIQEHDLPIQISVNITSDDLEDIHFPEQVLTLLEQYHYPAHYLGLEITEDSLITELEESIEAINQLNAEGVRFYLDDFGTGYSSIAYLKKLPIQSLKIDRSFIQNLDSSENDVVIVKSTIALAKSLGLGVVAEGVESTTILKELNNLGCHLIQGYFICRPLSETEITSWLKNPPSGFSVKRPKLTHLSS